jgi:hypothetical protein
MPTLLSTTPLNTCFPFIMFQLFGERTSQNAQQQFGNYGERTSRNAQQQRGNTGRSDVFKVNRNDNAYENYFGNRGDQEEDDEDYFRNPGVVLPESPGGSPDRSRVCGGSTCGGDSGCFSSSRCIAEKGNRVRLAIGQFLVPLFPCSLFPLFHLFLFLCSFIPSFFHSFIPWFLHNSFLCYFIPSFPLSVK